MRYWDHDLGPAVPHLFWAGQLPGRRRRPARRAEPVALRDLTPDAGPPHGAGDDFTLSPDGRPAGPHRGRARRPGRPPHPARAHRDRDRRDPGARRRPAGRRLRRRASPPTARSLVCVRERLSTYAEPPDYTLLLVDVADGTARDLTAGLRPVAQRAAVLRRRHGGLLPGRRRRPARVFRVPVAGGAPVRLTGDGAYSDLQVARDGSALYALRSAYDSPPLPGPAGPGDPAAGPGRAAQPRRRSARCPAPCTRWRRPPPTAPGCSPGWCCPRARRRSPPRRCCCGSTADR